MRHWKITQLNIPESVKLRLGINNFVFYFKVQAAGQAYLGSRNMVLSWKLEIDNIEGE